MRNDGVIQTEKDAVVGVKVRGNYTSKKGKFSMVLGEKSPTRDCYCCHCFANAFCLYTLVVNMVRVSYKEDFCRSATRLIGNHCDEHIKHF